MHSEHDLKEQSDAQIIVSRFPFRGEGCCRARLGPGPGRCLPVFPKVDAASPRRLMAPPGLTALGAKGSACDRLRLTGGLRAFALGRYIVPLRWEGGRPLGAPFFMPPLAAKTGQPGFARRKTIQPPCGRRKCFPPCPLRGTSPASGGRITRAYCSATYERIALRSFIVPPLRGGKVVP